FDGSVECQQVGLLGNALDHLEDLADVFGAGIDRLYLLAGRIDGGGQGSHRRDGLFHHLPALFGLIVGIAGLTGGVGGIARNLLRGSTQFIDRRRYAFGAGALFTGASERRVGGIHYPYGKVMHLSGSRGDLADGGMDALDEAVERGTELTEFVLTFHV